VNSLNGSLSNKPAFSIFSAAASSIESPSLFSN